MSAPTSTPPPLTPQPRPAPKRSGRRWIIAAIAVPVALLAVILLLILISSVAPSPAPPERPNNTEELHPDNSGPDGTMVLTRVLADRGVDVTQVRGLRSLESRDHIGPETTVVITRSELLNYETGQRFLELTARAHRIVVIDADAGALRALDLPVTAPPTALPSGLTPTAACNVSGIVSPNDQVAAAQRYTVAGRATGCFTVDDVSALVYVPGNLSRADTVVLGPDMVFNSTIGDYDNAGVAIRAIAGTDSVLWYQPRFQDQVDAAEEPKPQLPSALWPMLVLALIVGGALSLWRGRRFGPLVTEPLPAVVKAIETTQARGRLYYRAKADDRAATTLRNYTLHRVARYLGLPFDAGRDGPGTAGAQPVSPALEAIIDAVATTSGRDRNEVGTLLAGPVPSGEDALIHFTSALSILDKEVRRL